MVKVENRFRTLRLATAPALLALLLLAACAARQPVAAQKMLRTSRVAGMVAEADGSGLTDRSVIRSGRLELKARELEPVKDRVERIVAEIDGFVSSFTLTTDRRLDMLLRVPEPRLDDTMDRIGALGRVTSRSVSSRDVTDELIDLEARLRNLTALRDRLRAYLDRAADLKEILEVERELARVQSEIESIEARLEALRQQVALSELSLTVRSKGGWFR